MKITDYFDDMDMVGLMDVVEMIDWAKEMADRVSHRYALDFFIGVAIYMHEEDMHLQGLHNQMINLIDAVAENTEDDELLRIGILLAKHRLRNRLFEASNFAYIHFADLYEWGDDEVGRVKAVKHGYPEETINSNTDIDTDEKFAGALSTMTGQGYYTCNAILNVAKEFGQRVIHGFNTWGLLVDCINFKRTLDDLSAEGRRNILDMLANRNIINGIGYVESGLFALQNDMPSMLQDLPDDQLKAYKKYQD